MEQVYFLFDKDESIVYSLGNYSEAKRNLPYADYLTVNHEVVLFGDKKNDDIYDEIMSEVGKSIINISLDGDDGVIAKNDDSGNIVKTLDYINMSCAEFDDIYNNIGGEESRFLSNLVIYSFDMYYRKIKEGIIQWLITLLIKIKV